MQKWIDVKGPVLADTVYCEGELVAKDTEITLPAVNFKTSEFSAMGTAELPLPLIEAMEASVKKVGADMGLLALCRFGSHALEVRWVQDVKKSDGTTKSEGCKAFLRVASKGIPEMGLVPGDNSESDIALACTRYQVFVGGHEMWLIDQINGILRIDGTDYAKQIASLL